jgi:protein kinase-like protein
MQGFFPTSVFLDSTCFSPPPFPIPLYHNPRIMSTHLPGHRPIHPSFAGQHIEPPLTRPSGQERLLQASAAPNHFHNLSFPTHPSAVNPTQMHPLETFEMKRTALAPFHAHAAGIVSRMYSSHFPGYQILGNHINALLRKELRNRVIDTTTDFILQIFTDARKPFAINDNFYKTLSQTRVDIHGKPCPPLWDQQNRTLRPPAYTESDLTDWLNRLSEVMGTAYGLTSTRIWSYRCKDTPLVGSSIQRKPDVILIDKSYESLLKSSYDLDTDWSFIRAFSEVTSEQRTPARMIDSINAKSYLIFQCQVNRRFVVGLSFTGNGKFTLTLTDREGQLRWKEMPLFENKKHVDVFFYVFSFLMFGEDSDIGLDPRFEVDAFGKLQAVTIDEKRFVVEDKVYELSCIVGRATRVWVVKHDKKKYVLKDSWVQEHHLDSEVSILQKMTEGMKTHKNVAQSIKDSIPQFVCGGDVMVDGILDCTGRYRKDLRGWPESQRIHRRIISSPIGEPIITFRSKKEFIQAIISIVEGALLFHDYMVKLITTS